MDYIIFEVNLSIKAAFLSCDKCNESQLHLSQDKKAASI